MSFYGNITSNPLTTYDKIYPNRYLMDQNASSDGVLPGRQILIEYDTPFDSGDLQIDLSEINGNYEKNRTIDATQYANKNYDSTVWKKIYANGSYYYAQIAELNGVGFRKAEFYNNNELKDSVSGEGSNSLLKFIATDGVAFTPGNNNQDISIKNSLEFDVNKEAGNIIKNGNKVSINIDPYYVSSSPEIELNGKEINFNALNTPCKTLYENFAITRAQDEEEYHYRGYTNFYLKVDDNKYELIKGDSLIDLDARWQGLGDGTEIYVQNSVNNYQLLGTISSNIKAQTFNLRRSNLSSQEIIISGSMSNGKDIGYDYIFYNTGLLQIDCWASGARLGNSIPSGVIAANVLEVKISSTKVNPNHAEFGLGELSTNNFLTQLSNVERIEFDIDRKGNNIRGLALQAHCLPKGKLIEVNFQGADVYFSKEGQGVGNLGIGSETVLKLGGTPNQDDKYGSGRCVPIVGKVHEEDEDEIELFWVQYYQGVGSQYLTPGYTLVYISPKAVDVDLSKELHYIINSNLKGTAYITSIHQECIKNLPNLKTIKYRDKEVIDVNEYNSGYMITDSNSTPIVQQDLFPYRNTCPNLTSIQNLALRQNPLSKSQPGWFSNKDGYIVRKGVTIDFISSKMGINSLNKEILDLNCPAYWKEYNVENFSPYAFGYNFELINIDLPEGLTVIPKGIFDHCEALRSITYRTLTNRLKAVSSSSLPKECKVYIANKDNIDILRLLIPQERIILNSNYNTNLYFIFNSAYNEKGKTEWEKNIYTPMALPALPSDSSNLSNLKWIEKNTEKEYYEGNSIDTKNNTRILDYSSFTVNLNLYCGKGFNLCEYENEKYEFIDKKVTIEAENTISFTIEGNKTTWKEIIEKLKIEKVFEQNWFQNDIEEYYYSTIYDENEIIKIADLNQIICNDFNIKKANYYIGQILKPKSIAIVFWDSLETVISNQYYGWGTSTGQTKVVLKVPEIIPEGKRFIGWSSAGKQLMFEYTQENKWKKFDDSSTLLEGWKVEEDGQVSTTPSATDARKQYILYPVYEQLEGYVRITNPIGFKIGNNIQLNQLPLQSFVDLSEKLPYISTTRDNSYTDIKLWESEIYSKILEGFTYNLSFSTLGTIKFKIEDSKLKCAFIDEEDNEIYLTQEESERILGKDYIKQTIVGLLKTKEE